MLIFSTGNRLGYNDRPKFLTFEEYTIRIPRNFVSLWCIDHYRVGSTFCTCHTSHIWCHTVYQNISGLFIFETKRMWCVRCWSKINRNTILMYLYPWLTHPPLSASYMRQWIGSALVQIMACRLFGAKPLSKPECWDNVNWTLRNKLQWNPNQNLKKNHQRKCIRKYRRRNGGHFVQRMMS